MTRTPERKSKGKSAKKAAPGKKALARSPKNSTAGHKDHWGRVCRECPSICCTDLAMPVHRPRTPDEISELKWHLHYDTMHVAIRSHRWYLVVKGKCIYLGEDSLCTIYDRRPDKCRKHKPPECEGFDCWYDTLLTTPEELDEHLKRRR